MTLLKTIESDADFSAKYHEESAKIPILSTAVILLLIAAPFIVWIVKINNDGAKANNVSKYENLAQLVASDVRMVDAMLRNDAAALAAMYAGRKIPVVTLIVPEVVIVENRKDEPAKVTELNVELEGIYWSPANPLVGIGGETYRIGDMIRGYEIIRIGKTMVQFQSSDGTIVVKDMYENLLQNNR